MESSYEERGQSHITELLKNKKELELELEKKQEVLQSKIKENQDLHLELKKFKWKSENAIQKFEDAMAKQKACELENEIKKFEISEQEKIREKLINQISELKKTLSEQSERHQQEITNKKKELESHILKIQHLESEGIKDKIEVNNKLKQKEQELTLKTSWIEDYKKQMQGYIDEISDLKIQNKSLSISQINMSIAEDVDRGSFADDQEDEDDSSDRQKKKEIQELLKNNPTKGTEELYKVWRATAKELRIERKKNGKLEDQFEELKEDVDEMKQDERESVEISLKEDVLKLELEKENIELKKLLESKGQDKEEEENIKANAEIK